MFKIKHKKIFHFMHTCKSFPFSCGSFETQFKFFSVILGRFEMPLCGLDEIPSNCESIKSLHVSLEIIIFQIIHSSVEMYPFAP